MAVSPIADCTTPNARGRPNAARRAVEAVLSLSLDAFALVREAQQARGYARTADADHDRALQRCRAHIHLAGLHVVSGDVSSARRHLIAADACAARAQEHDAAEDRQLGIVDRLLDAVLGVLRCVNGALDGLLSAGRGSR